MAAFGSSVAAPRLKVTICAGKEFLCSIPAFSVLDRIFSAIIVPPSNAVLGRITTNSSPPYRAQKSVVLSRDSFIICATFIKHESPSL